MKAIALGGLLLATSWVFAAPVKESDKVRVNLPIIEVLDPSGTLTEPFVRSALTAVEPKLLACATDAKWQSTALAWIVTDWRGKVTKLELAVDSPAVEKCMTPVLKAIVVGKAQVRATTFVKLVVGKAPKDAIVNDLQ